MRKNNRNVIFGFLGSIRDSGFDAKRFQRYRPTIGLCAQEDFAVDVLELFLDREEHRELAEYIQNDLSQISPQTEVRIHVFDFKNSWDLAEVYGGLKDFADHYEFDDKTNYFVHTSTGTDMAKLVLFLLTEARHIPAKMLSTQEDRGSQEPWRGLIQVTDLDLSKYDALLSRFQKQRANDEMLLKGGIVTRNPAFNELIGEIEHVCLRSTAPILLTGPTGAGKSHLTRRIFELRQRRHLVSGPFIEVNCATLTSDNAISALFGHTKGAFTGAASDRQGYLKSADKGILLLDEIGELGLNEQAMLLRALEDKSFHPLGSDKVVKSDFQLIAGTNRDLAAEVSAGRFRADLYARINQWCFRLPGLSERREDIEPNLEFELDRASAELNCRVSFNSAARGAYLHFAQTFSWAGNFRDLAASVNRMATLAHGGRITAQDVSREIKRLTQFAPPSEANQVTGAPAAQNTPDLSSIILPGAEIDEFDRVQLNLVLSTIRNTPNMAEAGRRLFAASREQRATRNDSDRVKKYLGRWGLDYNRVRELLHRQDS